MSEQNHFLAIDFGAESGRGIVVTLGGDKVRMKEIHRWPNRPVRLGDTMHWDFPYLFAEMLQAMRICGDEGIELDAIGVDTWGVDFGLLTADGALLSNPVQYRDHRTDNIHEYSNPIMPREEIFTATGYEPWPISSLFQLLSMQRDGSRLLGIADAFLNMPDLFNYFLTGCKANDRSVANTSNLMATDGQWSSEIIERFSLPKKIFGRLVEPATVLGDLSPAIAESTGLGKIPVVTVGGHDTCSAVAAVPAQGENWAFLSCGTWSILGTLVEKPVTGLQVLQLGYSNEYSLGGWFLARNILGLWLVQELRKKWDSPGEPWDYPKMTSLAGQADGFSGLVDVADQSLMAPADMEQALLENLARGNQGKPNTPGELIRCVLESLAMEYARSLEVISELTGKRHQSLYMVGGGIANKLLCQFTADACGIEVQVGANECTAMGNALAQARALGILSDNEQIRQVVRNSVEMQTYKPREQDLWKQKREQYYKIINFAKR